MAPSIPFALQLPLMRCGAHSRTTNWTIIINKMLSGSQPSSIISWMGYKIWITSNPILSGRDVVSLRHRFYKWFNLPTLILLTLYTQGHLLAIAICNTIGNIPRKPINEHFPILSYWSGPRYSPSGLFGGDAWWVFRPKLPKFYFIVSSYILYFYS